MIRIVTLYAATAPALLANRRAVTSIEYALIALLIAVVIVSSLKVIGINLSTTFSSSAQAL